MILSSLAIALLVQGSNGPPASAQNGPEPKRSTCLERKFQQELDEELNKYDELRPKLAEPVLKATPRSAGEMARFEVAFVNGDEELLPSQDGIVMLLDREIQLPESIPPDEIKINYELLSNGMNSGGPDFGSGLADSVEITDPDDRDGHILLTIFPKIERGNEAIAIPGGARVTVVIGENAKVANPLGGGIFSWEVGFTKGPTLPQPACHPDPYVLEAFESVEDAAGDEHGLGHEEAGLLVDWEVRLSEEGPRRKEEITITGRGFGTRSAATFDGVYQNQTEATLCSATSDEKGVASCTYRVTNPPFRPGFGECYLDPGKETTGEHDHEPIRDCNFVNAVDGHGHTSILILNKKRVEANSVADAFQVLELVATLEVTDFSRPHRTFRLHLLDISPGVLKAVTVGGLPADLGDFFDHPIGEGGELYVTALMPGRLPAGRQNLRVISQDQNGAREDRSDVFIDNRLVVEASPQQASPNQRVRLVIYGFTDSEIRHISIDGVPVDLKRVRGYDGDPPRVDSRGRWAGTIIWLTDGISLAEEDVLLALAEIARKNPTLAHRLFGLALLEEEVTSFRARAFIILGRLAKHDTAYLEYLIGQPWFQDGLSLDDVALIIAARGGCGNVF